MQFVLALLAAVALLFAHARLGALDRLALALLVVASVSVVGGLFDRRRWAFYGELLRLAALAGVALAALGRLAPAQLVVASAGVALVVGAFAAWLLRHRGELLTARTPEAPALAAAS